MKIKVGDRVKIKRTKVSRANPYIWDIVYITKTGIALISREINAKEYGKLHISHLRKVK